MAATILCLVAGITVFLPSSPLSTIWAVKPEAFAQLIEFVPWSGSGFLLLAAFMGAAAWGCWKRRLWGWRLAIAIFIANGVGDVWQILNGRLLEGAFGVAVALALAFWLTRSSVKAAFE